MSVAAICSAACIGAPANAAAAAADPSSDALAEVVVTAEKQTETLQKTPAQVTAITAQGLTEAGVTDLREAQMIVPAVRFQAEGNNTQVFVRGVGANLDFPNVEPNVAFNFAGVYLPREATSAAFFDVAQLEILPGSQGTLYGRSAIGGTIVLTPSKPGFDFDGATLLEVGNYSAVHVTVTQNAKLSEMAAVRAAVDYAYNDGFMVTGSDSKNDISARLSTIIKPIDNLTIYLYAQDAQKRGHTENLVNKGTDPVTGAYCEMCFLHSNPWDDTRTGQFAAPFGETAAERNHYKTELVGGEISYDFDGMTLSYVPSYLYLDARPLYWLSAIQSTNTAHYNQIEQELRLASSGNGPWKWLAGLSYYNSRNSGSEYLFTNLPFSFYQTNVEADRLLGYAAFGQVTYSLTDTLRVTGGGRASSTQRTARGFEVVALGGEPYTFDKTYTHFDWKVGLEYDVAPAVMLYGVVQTGFQAGTFNALPDTPGFSNEVKPEQLRSYTLGMKSRWLDDRLQINNEVYWYDFHNLIIQAYDISAPYNLIFNGRKVVVKGDQLDVLARVSSADELNLDVSYSRARNEDVVDTNGNNYNGLAPAYTPDWVIQAGYTHSIPLGNAYLRAHVNWRYESKWWADYVHNLGTEQTADNKIDASLTYDADTWTVGAWVKNATNKAVIAATAAAGIPGPATAYMEDPRTYGVRFTIKY
ncbi:MAG TPA: TonB-dependent receptor [Steroidobacteraceae bacterium]|nr:TonB-dependent receptor [Steroidobacteraceae bacterium]